MRIYDLILHDGLHDQFNRKVVFMAGSPGSGKTTVRTRIFGRSLKVVDPDSLAQLMQRSQTNLENIDFSPHPLSAQAEKFRLSWLRQGLGMIIDGTGRNFQDYQQKRQQFLSYNYSAAMILVRTPFEVAQSNAEQRFKHTGRKVDFDYLKDTWQKIENNRANYNNLFQDAYWEVENWGTQAEIQISTVGRQVRNWLSQTLHT